MKSTFRFLFKILICALLVGPIFFKTRALAGDGYTLALFPIKVIVNWGEGFAERTESLAAEGVANLAADDPLLELGYSYQKVGDITGASAIEDAVDRRELDVWRQASFFGNYSPDWHQVKAVGSGLDADIAVLVRIRDDQSSLVAVYLYDYRKGKTYTKTSEGVYYGSMAAGVQKIANTILQEFYDEQ